MAVCVCVCVWMCVCMCTGGLLVPTYTRAYIKHIKHIKHTSIQTHMHTRVQARAHTHTHIHTYTQAIVLHVLGAWLNGRVTAWMLAPLEPRPRVVAFLSLTKALQKVHFSRCGRFSSWL